MPVTSGKSVKNRVLEAAKAHADLHDHHQAQAEAAHASARAQLDEQAAKVKGGK